MLEPAAQVEISSSATVAIEAWLATLALIETNDALKQLPPRAWTVDDHLGGALRSPRALPSLAWASQLSPRRRLVLVGAPDRGRDGSHHHRVALTEEIGE